VDNNNRVTKEEETGTSSNPTRIGRVEQLTAPVQAQTGELSVRNVASDEEIRLRAYEIYLERGETSGLELDDWLQAQCELESGAL
jgi:hypothetical protein